MLYWGEGLKSGWACVSISNTNPSIIRFALRWLMECCGVSKERLKVRFHFYSDMDVDLEHKYWSELLNLPLTQFRRPYIKQSTKSGITEKGGFGHGTCDLLVNDTVLKEKIMMGIKVVAESIAHGVVE